MLVIAKEETLFVITIGHIFLKKLIGKQRQSIHVKFEIYSERNELVS